MKKLGISHKIIILTIALVVIFSSIVTLSLQENVIQNEIYSYDGVPRAVIIDQLHNDIPGTSFQTKATELLTTAGYEVDVFTTDELLVDFYKKLPLMNYEFIVVRSHAIGSNGPNIDEDEPVAIFTGEKYRDDKYIHEQLSGQILKGAPFQTSNVDVSVDLSQWNQSEGAIEISTSWEFIDDSDPYFLIGSKYVDEQMEGRFPNSVVVLAGCSTLSNPSLAKSFINRGASTVIGWDNLIENFNNDSTTLLVLENLLIKNMETQEAVQAAMELNGRSNQYKAKLSYYEDSL